MPATGFSTPTSMAIEFPRCRIWNKYQPRTAQMAMPACPRNGPNPTDEVDRMNGVNLANIRRVTQPFTPPQSPSDSQQPQPFQRQNAYDGNL